MLGVFAFLIGFWVLSSYVDWLSPGLVAFIGLGVLFVTGTLTWEAALGERSAWDVFVWYGGLLTLGGLLNETGVTVAFTGWVGGWFTGVPWIAVLVVALVIYFYTHYFFASTTVHALALYGPFVTLLVGVGAPAGIVVYSLLFLNNLQACLTPLRHHDLAGHLHRGLRQPGRLVARRVLRLGGEPGHLAGGGNRVVEGAGVVVMGINCRQASSRRTVGRQRASAHGDWGWIGVLALAAACAAGCGAGEPPPMEPVAAAVQVHDLVIAGGRVVDPETGLDAVRHVGIRDGAVASVSEFPLIGSATVDAAGLVVAPGFIDLHAHGQDPASNRYQAMDGVTTALELEIGAYPVDRWYRRRGGASLINYGASVSHQGARVRALGSVFAARQHRRDVLAGREQRRHALPRCERRGARPAAAAHGARAAGRRHRARLRAELYAGGQAPRAAADVRDCGRARGAGVHPPAVVGRLPARRRAGALPGGDRERGGHRGRRSTSCT